MLRSSLVGLRRQLVALGLLLVACGGGQPPQSPEASAEPTTEASDAPSADEAAASSGDTEADGETAAAESDDPNAFKTLDTHTAKDTHGVAASKLKPTKTEALIKLIVVDRDKGPLEGVVASVVGADGRKFYPPETDAVGYTEVLVPVGQKYEIVYLGLGHADVAGTTMVDNEPNLTMKLTLRFKGFVAVPGSDKNQHFTLDGVNFDTGKATIRRDSHPRLDEVAEYMTHKKSVRIEISGHTDNVGKPAANKALSEKRAQACRDYLVKKGINGSRIQAVGYGDARPIAPNDTAAGRQQNRRIEATEL
jgi:outer membrane protein OmpA-like peptidoglycan-associated protein